MLTNREKQVLFAIEQYRLKNGYAPTYTELGNIVGLRSRSAVHKYVQRLLKKGCLRQHPNGLHRTLSLTLEGRFAISNLKTLPKVDPREEQAGLNPRKRRVSPC